MLRVEHQGQLLVLHIAAGDEQGGLVVVAGTGQDGDPVRRPRQAEGAADLVHDVFLGRLLAMVQDQHAHPVSIPQRLQRRRRLVVEVVGAGVVAAPGDRPELRPHIHHDEPGRGRGLDPLLQHAQAARPHARTIHADMQTLRRLLLQSPQDLPGSRLHPTQTILQRQVENVPLLDLDRVQGLAARRDRDAQIESEERLAQLRLARQDRQPLRENPWQHPARLRQVHPHDAGQGVNLDALRRRAGLLAGGSFLLALGDHPGRGLPRLQARMDGGLDLMLLQADARGCPGQGLYHLVALQMPRGHQLAQRVRRTVQRVVTVALRGA